MIPSHRTRDTGTCVGERTIFQPSLKAEISGTTQNMLSSHRYIVSASTSPNQTLRLGVKFSPFSSTMATSPPPFSCRHETCGTGVTDDETAPIPSQNEYSALSVLIIGQAAPSVTNSFLESFAQGVP